MSEANQKVNAPSWAMPYMSLSGRKLQVDSFLTHSLVTAPLIWILHNRITYYTGTKRHPLNNY